MWLDCDREIIESNVYHIPERLREIDPEYFIVRNHKTHKFEVHHWGQKDGTLSLILPYDELDQRTIERVRSTRIEYIDRIISEMDKHNERLIASREKTVFDKSDQILREIHRYVSTHESKETIPEDAYSTRFI